MIKYEKPKSKNFLKEGWILIIELKDENLWAVVRSIITDNIFKVGFLEKGNSILDREKCKVFFNEEDERFVFDGEIEPAENNEFILKQSSPITPDKREHYRISMKVPVYLLENPSKVLVKPLNFMFKRWIKCKSFNISEGGIGIISDSPLPVNSKFFLRILIGKKPVEGVGEIKYCIEYEGKFLTGIEFVNFSEEAKEEIRKICRKTLKEKLSFIQYY